MNDDLGLVERLFAAVSWRGEAGYRFGDTERTLSSAAMLSPAGLMGKSPLLAEQLASDIYSAIYTRRSLHLSDTPDRPPKPEQPPRPRVMAPAMQLEEIASDGSLWASAQGLRRRLGAGEWVAASSTARPAKPDDVIWPVAAAHQGSAQPFFHRVACHGGVGRARPGALLRFYVHARPGASRGVLDALMTLAEPLHRPCLAKSWRVSAAHGRADSVVLYVERDHAPVFRPVLQTLMQTQAAQLAPEVPLFSLPLAAGIGLAEDPVSGESFGMERARLLAEVIMASPDADPKARLSALDDAFRASRLSLAHPHRNQRLHDRCDGPESWRLG